MLVKTAFCSPNNFICYFLNMLAIIHFLDHWCHNTLIYVIFHKHVVLPTTVIYQTCSLSCFISTMGAYYPCCTPHYLPATSTLVSPLPLLQYLCCTTLAALPTLVVLPHPCCTTLVELPFLYYPFCTTLPLLDTTIVALPLWYYLTLIALPLLHYSTLVALALCYPCCTALPSYCTTPALVALLYPCFPTLTVTAVPYPSLLH